MSKAVIEKNKLENIDLLQIEYFSDLPISEKKIIVVEINDSIAVRIRKYLNDAGFDDIYICKKIDEGIKIFSDFINHETSVPIIIDDNTQYEEIKSMVKEIAEIQPGANIAIMTTKEKEDFQMTELINLGATAIIQKPIDSQSFINIFSNINQKTNTKQSEKNKQDCNNKIITQATRISQNKIQDILKITEDEMQDVLRELLETKKIETESEILEAACNQCKSTNLTYTRECPNCNGINFKQQTLIEHYACGEVFPKKPQIDTCPKCNKDIGQVGTDYREFNDYYVCNSCNDKFSRLLSKFKCLDCNNFFIENLAVWKKGKVHKVHE